ncbi:MAG: DUF427 domain-containing protein [Spirochaetaceae bacterium]
MKKTTKSVESVWDYPRPPRLEASGERIVVKLAGRTIINTTSSYRVLETSHPPTYYLPKRDVVDGVLVPVDGTTFCEWKGKASYFDVVVGDRRASRAAWEYPSPTGTFAPLRDHIAIYPALMDEVYVDDERVRPQKGDYYGGWITANIRGPFKGGPGTWGW